MIRQNLFAICLYCGKKFKTIKWDIEHGKAKFCSRKCTDKGKIRLPNSGQFKKGQFSGAKHHNWKVEKLQILLDMFMFIILLIHFANAKDMLGDPALLWKNISEDFLTHPKKFII